MSGVPGFSVIYDGNGSTGGSVPVDDFLYRPNKAVFVFGNTGGLVRVGYVFRGWAFSSSATTPDFTVIDDVVEPSYFMIFENDVALYAVWTPLPTVTYHGNGHTGGAALLAEELQAITNP